VKPAPAEAPAETAPVSAPATPEVKPEKATPAEIPAPAPKAKPADGTSIYEGTELYVEPEPAKPAEVVYGTLTNSSEDEQVKITKLPFTIGRSSEFTDYVIPNPRISSIHARITSTDDGVLQITDVNSLNHVRVNEEKLEPQTPHSLSDGDVIRLADVELKYTAVQP
jgi:pSer/pThr/pTyr-binding forkhead associated (FHA) protein